MAMHKTAKAREELERRSGALSAFERRVLILCDGVRDASGIVRMLGPEAADALRRLVQDGYVDGAGALPAARPGTGKPLPPPAAPVRPAPDLGPAPSPASAVPPPPTARRSLAASKMYLIDMLQLQRNADASALAADIHDSRDPDLLAEAMARGLEHICRVASPSVSQRVVARLVETVPEAMLPLIEAAGTIAERRAATP